LFFLFGLVILQWFLCLSTIEDHYPRSYHTTIPSTLHTTTTTPNTTTTTVLCTYYHPEHLLYPVRERSNQKHFQNKQINKQEMGNAIVRTVKSLKSIQQITQESLSKSSASLAINPQRMDHAQKLKAQNSNGFHSAEQQEQNQNIDLEAMEKQYEQMLKNEERYYYTQMMTTGERGISREEELLQKLSSNVQPFPNNTAWSKPDEQIHRSYNPKTKEKLMEKELNEKEAPPMQEEYDDEYYNNTQYMTNLQKLSDNIVTNYVHTSRNAEVRIGKARARPYDDNEEPSKGTRVHLESQLEKETKGTNNTLSTKSTMEREMEIEGTFTIQNIKQFLNMVKEKEFLYSDPNNKNAPKNKDWLEADIKVFAEKHKMDVQVVKNIMKYTNSVYIVKATRNHAFGFWHKPRLSDPIWSSSNLKE
jgi:hypothetical protein